MYLPAWSKTYAPYWYERVGTRPFLFAVWILTLLAFGIAAAAHIAGPDSLAYALLASYTLGQGANVFLPHVAAGVAFRTYAPGLLTGVVLVLRAPLTLSDGADHCFLSVSP